jgi:hypothetical protein
VGRVTTRWIGYTGSQVLRACKRLWMQFTD